MIRSLVTSTLLKRFLKRNEGVAAMEFALIAPVLILMMIGTLEISHAVSVDRKVSRVTSTVADLVTRGTSGNSAFTTCQIDAIMDVSEDIMFPYDTQAHITVIGVDIDEDGDTSVVWSRSNGTNNISNGSSYTIPDAIKKEGFILVADVDASYSPLYSFVGFENGSLSFDNTDIELEETMYLRPRQTGTIDLDVGAC